MLPARSSLDRLMTWKRLTLVAWLAAVGCACVGGASFVFQFSRILHRDDATKYAVNLDHGNLRLVRLDAELIASTIGENEFDNWTALWLNVRTSAFQIIDRTVHLPDGTVVTERGLCVTVFLPLITLLAGWSLIVFPVCNRSRLRKSIAEIARLASCPASLASCLRRATLGVLSALAIFLCAVWVISYTGIPRLRAPRTLLTFDAKVSLPIEADDPSVVSRNIELLDGKALFATWRDVPEDVNLPQLDYEMAGFRIMARSWGLPRFTCFLAYSSLTEAEQRMSRADKLYQQAIQVPIGLCFALTFLWPTVAFLRGPWRRAKRGTLGTCLSCGYNLTGLVEPRCPECGTTTTPDRIPDVSTAMPSRT